MGLNWAIRKIIGPPKPHKNKKVELLQKRTGTANTKWLQLLAVFGLGFRPIRVTESCTLAHEMAFEEIMALAASPSDELVQASTEQTVATTVENALDTDRVDGKRKQDEEAEGEKQKRMGRRKCS